MSRGPGRWQRELLTAMYEHPNVAPSGVHYVHVQTWLRDYLGREPTPAEESSVYRARRSLVARGWVKGGIGTERMEPMPGYEHRPFATAT